MNGRCGAGVRTLVAAAGLSAAPAWALPTMIRLGYTNCAACHISPQGGGLLNVYGRGIDEAQSYRGGDYAPSENRLLRALSWGGRITQDVRSVTMEQGSTATGQPLVGRLRTRLMYRNATELGKGFRVSVLAFGENEGTPRPSLPYDHGIRPDRMVLQSALISYRPKENLEFAAGRDLLPSGIYLSDLTPFYRSRNRLGVYDTPTQVKMFWWGKRYQISPYAFAPGGNERTGEGESGGGTLAEFDLLGRGRTVVGVNLMRGSARHGDRLLTGVYTRLGFGRWGILAEHDITSHTLRQPALAEFRQHATYAQCFYAVREWLVVSLIGEHLSVGKPYREDLNAGKVEVAARITSNLTLSINTRIQRNAITGAWGPSAALQLALKTSN